MCRRQVQGRPTTVRPSEELGPLVERMDEADVDALAVTSSDGRLLGMFDRRRGLHVRNDRD